MSSSNDSATIPCECISCPDPDQDQEPDASVYALYCEFKFALASKLIFSRGAATPVGDEVEGSAALEVEVEYLALHSESLLLRYDSSVSSTIGGPA